ncbi:MAG: thioredoxin family protein, partial [Coleofasciculus chthonoplastes F3-SA18-01]
LLVFYIDDSKDCKQFSTVVSQLQAPYGRAASFIPVSADTLYDKPSDDPMEPGYYYEGLVPRSESIELKRRPINEINTELRSHI